MQGTGGQWPVVGLETAEVVLTLCACENGTEEFETIEYAGRLWIVPEWIVATDGTRRRPKRIIRIDVLDCVRLAVGNHPYQYVLQSPMPKSVLNGDARTVQGIEYEVVEEPDLRAPLSQKDEDQP